MKKVIYIVLLLNASVILFAEPAPIVLDPTYEHDKWGTLPKDIIFKFAAYTTSFDSADDNNGDNSSDIWGIPEWVSYEIKALVKEHPLTNRPTWMTDKNLFNTGIAPNDNSYAVHGTTNLEEVKLDYRFIRGHMCPKDTAERISRDAAYNTHILLNAVPQLQWQNNGIWKKIETLCTDWADEYDRIWVICGPVFFDKTPSMWLGQDNEMRIAIPDALYKIIIREDSNEEVKTLSFLIPNIVPKEKDDIDDYITTVDRIEKATGLNFLTTLKEKQDEVESVKGDLRDW